MADKIATYAFIDKEQYEAAKYKIINELSSGSWDSGSTNEYWLLHITSDCNDPGLAAKICSGYGGKPY